MSWLFFLFFGGRFFFFFNLKDIIIMWRLMFRRVQNFPKGTTKLWYVQQFISWATTKKRTSKCVLTAFLPYAPAGPLNPHPLPKKERVRERETERASWCLEPSQPQRERERGGGRDLIRKAPNRKPNCRVTIIAAPLKQNLKSPILQDPDNLWQNSKNRQINLQRLLLKNNNKSKTRKCYS